MDWTTIAELGGLFAVTFLTPNISFFLPIRPTILTVVLAQTLPWFWVGLVATAGFTIGALPLYFAGWKASDTTTVRRWLEHKWFARLFQMFKKSMFLLLLVLVITPLPDQLVGLAGGAEKYSLKKFLLANVLGRAVVYFPLAYIAATNHATMQSAWEATLKIFSL